MNKKRKGQYMPFNALKGFNEYLREAERELEKEEEIILSEDKLEELNYKLEKIINLDLCATFLYLNNGKKETICDYVEKIDKNNLKIYFKSKKSLDIKSIYDIIL